MATGLCWASFGEKSITHSVLMCSFRCRTENALRNFLFHAQAADFDLNCEGLCILALMVSEGFKRKWTIPGGEQLLLELIPTVFLHIYRVLCVHKLRPSLSKTVIGHAYAFNPSSATLLAPSPLEEAMLEKQLPLKSRLIQVQAEPPSQWSASVPSTIVDCISLLRVIASRAFFCDLVTAVVRYSDPRSGSTRNGRRSCMPTAECS